MNLSRFRRKSFISLKKRRQTKRRQTKRRQTKKFNIRKRYHMRGGTWQWPWSTPAGEGPAGEEPKGQGWMVILTEQDIITIKDSNDIFPYVKTNIANGMGLEHNPDANIFSIHKTDGTMTMSIYRTYNPNTYGTLLNIYNSGKSIPVTAPKERPYDPFVGTQGQGSQGR
jgi:hypothetical protein